jgi:hypothetical protein
MMLSRMRSGGRWLAVAVLVAAAGCSHGDKKEKQGDVRCPESRDLTCIAGKDCTMDRERGCEVCQCARGDALSPTDQRRPEAMQPTQFGR